MKVGPALMKLVVISVRTILVSSFLAAFLSGHFPPAHAQTPYDERQDDRIVRNHQDLEEMRKENERLAVITNATHDAQNHMEGVTEGFGALLTLMLAGSITIQVRSKQKG